MTEVEHNHQPEHGQVCRVSATVSLLAGLAAPAYAQPKQFTLSGPTQCSECIDRFLFATITDSTFPGGALGDVATIHVNGDSTFLVIAGPDGDELFFADETGAITQRVGRKGDGPGEYRGPQYVLETPLNYLILDSRLRRVTRLSKVDLGVQGSVPAPASAISAPVAFRDGSYAIRADIPTREHVGYPLHVVSPTGRLVRSFGGSDQSLPGAAPVVLAAADSTAVWAGYVDRYRVEKWSRQGKLLAVYEREADWYPPREEPPAAGQPYARISGLHQDEAGRLWVHVVIRKTVEIDVPTEHGVQKARRLDPDPGEFGEHH